MRDAVVAVSELQPADASATDAILQLLGLGRASATGPAAAQDIARRAVPPVPGVGPAPVPVPPAVPPPRVEQASSSPPLRALLTRTGRAAQSSPAWLAEDGGKGLPRARDSGAPPAPLPIFAPLERRGIYTAALSTWVEEDEVDIVRAVNELANARPLRAVPRMPLRTLRRGVQLLLDVGPNMAPYMADVARLEDEIGTLLSGAQIARFFFTRCPTRRVRESARAPRRPWPAPPRGMPVLVVSDFGIADAALDEDAAPVAEWRRFALEVRAEGHPMIGLVPFAAARWPAALSEIITFVHWSERTIAGAVDRALREAQRRFR